jgi:predicted alpha/beta hydrolase family esterase
MVTYGDVRRWQPGPIDDAVGQLNARCQQLVGLSDELAAAGAPDSWSGQGAATATARRNELTTRMEQAVAGIAAVRRGLGEAADAVTGLQHALTEADGIAKANNFQIDDAGAVIDPGPSPDTPLDQLNAVEAERQKVSDDVKDRVKQILARAEVVDNDLADLLGKAERGEIGDGGATTLAAAADAGAGQGGLADLAPPPGGTPEDVHSWWATLSDAERQRASMANPALIGSLDGVPVVDRDKANRMLLGTQMQQLDSEKHTLEALSGNLTDAQRRQLQQITDVLGHPASADGTTTPSGLYAIQNRLDHPVGGQQAYLLGLDTNVQGKAIVAMGNPDTAANVCTYVPGTGADVGKISGDMDRSDKMLEAATKSGSPSTSVITWLNYDAPANLPLAAFPQFADKGAPTLDTFQDGLRATHEGAPSHNTVLGHSYGTTVVGHAASGGHTLNADDVALIASPGVGVDHANQLHLTGTPQDHVATHIHASTAQNDMIKVTNMNPSHIPVIGWALPDVDPLGPDPIKPDFGANTFTSSPGTQGPLETLGLSGAAHSEYWTKGWDGLANMGNVIAGKPTY